MHPHADWKSRAVSPADALSVINSGDRVFIHGAAATPTPLLDALVERTELENVRLYHLHLEGACRFLEPQHEGRFHSTSLFTGPSARTAVVAHSAVVKFRRRVSMPTPPSETSLAPMFWLNV